MVQEGGSKRPHTIPTLQHPVVCKLWLAGKCHFGKDCRFSHSMSHTNFMPQGEVPCKFWLAGKCHYGNSCRFSHPGTNGPNSVQANPTTWHRDQKIMDNTEIPKSKHHDENEKSKATITNFNYPCKLWLAGKHCNEQCRSLHSHTSGADVNFVAQLNGHLKAIIGIALPSNSSKLYSISHDQIMRIWDCHTGKCVDEIKIGQEIGCISSEDSWVFLCIPNEVKIWNSNSSFIDSKSMKCPINTGQINALAIISEKEMLLAGCKNGQVLMWKLNSKKDSFEFWKAVSPHNKEIVSLAVASGRFYSGSTDKTIKVWDIDSCQCLHTLISHSDTVTSLICWKDYLLSSSLDGTVKVWVATAHGSIEVTYTLALNQGVVSFCGVHDGKAKPVLICANSDNSVCIYDIPSFKERCKLFSSTKISCVGTGPGGLIFTGDEGGVLKVWQWAT